MESNTKLILKLNKCVQTNTDEVRRQQSRKIQMYICSISHFGERKRLRMNSSARFFNINTTTYYNIYSILYGIHVIWPRLGLSKHRNEKCVVYVECLWSMTMRKSIKIALKPNFHRQFLLLKIIYTYKHQLAFSTFHVTPKHRLDAIHTDTN